MKILELFKGTGSISSYYENRQDIEIISLDILKKYNPTICIDIMEFDYKVYKEGEFDIIWASPECKIFSSLQAIWIGKKWNSMEELTIERKKNACFINKTLEIIEYLKPKWYFVENPLYSTIWDYIDETTWNNSVIIDYCRFGTIYKKPTRILTNKKLDNVRCKRKGKHDFAIGMGHKKNNHKFSDRTTLNERYSIPQNLLKYLLD
tara:strand:- start:518 stop:1135 length:618 start_codon:yes stop_codon:yes gene_type:complete